MKKLLSSALFAFLLVGCLQSTTNSGISGVNRGQLMLISSQEMQEGANENYAKILHEARKNGSLNVDPKQTQRLRNIAKKLISQVGIFRSDATNWDWQVNIIESPTLNAWCMPGGKIAFYSGIIKKLDLSDGEIAAIMGHEISHALREHSRERASQEAIKNIGLSVTGALLGLDSQSMKLANLASHYAISLPFSRSHENEADSMGVELAARAGFDPNDAVKVWQKMQQFSSSAPLEILSTHPSHETRIANLSALGKKVYPLYLNAKNQ